MVDTEIEEGTEEAAPVIEAELLHGCPTNHSPTGDHLVHVTPDGLIELCTALVADGYTFLVDLCGVDYLTHPGRIDLAAGVEPQRFEIVVALLDPNDRRRLRVRVQVPVDEPTIPSLFDLFAGSEAMEREAFDMFGITFENHPDMTRILMPENWEGHPLRKDYGIGAIPVQFKSSNAGR